MSETVLKILLGELVLVRVKCGPCGQVVECPVERLGRQENDCRLCGKTFDVDNLPGVILYIDPRGVKAFADQGAGQKVAVRSTCKGAKKDARARPEYVVILENCILVGGE